MKSQGLSIFALRVRGAFALLVAFLGVGLVTTMAEEQVFEVKGVVRGPVVEGTVLIEHEEIDGFMPAMTMPFYLGENEPKTRIDFGDTVSFRFVVGKGESRAEAFTVLERAGRLAGGGDSAAVKSSAGQVGDWVPELMLIDERGVAIGRKDFEGHYTVVTFIFSRCPVPEFCPLLAMKFGRLQTLLDGEGSEEGVRLLSVTLDPEYDSPEVLAGYAARVGADAKRWRFATGEVGEVAKLARFANLAYSGEGVAISHELRTLLIDPEGKLKKVWSGNRWKPEEVLEEISK